MKISKGLENLMLINFVLCMSLSLPALYLASTHLPGWGTFLVALLAMLVPGLLQQAIVTRLYQEARIQGAQALVFVDPEPEETPEPEPQKHDYW